MKKPALSADETLFQQLVFAGYRVKREYQFYHPHRRWKIDFFLPAHELGIEVEGVRWRGQGRHQTAAGFTGDCEKYNTFVLMRYRLLRFTPQMVFGKAKRATKGKEPMEPAIDIIDRLCLGSGWMIEVDRGVEGYATRALEKKSLEGG